MKRALALLSVFLLSACLEQGGIAIDTPYAFATAPSAKNGAAFMTITNGGKADTLLAASADIAERTEIHDMDMEDGVMKMRQLDQLIIPSRENIELSPHGKHIMFMNLHAPLEEGTMFDLTLNFANAGEMVFPVRVTAPGQTPPSDAHDHDHADHDSHDHDDHGHHSHH